MTRHPHAIVAAAAAVLCSLAPAARAGENEILLKLPSVPKSEGAETVSTGQRPPTVPTVNGAHSTNTVPPPPRIGAPDTAPSKLMNPQQIKAAFNTCDAGVLEMACHERNNQRHYTVYVSKCAGGKEHAIVYGGKDEKRKVLTDVGVARDPAKPGMVQWAYHGTEFKLNIVLYETRTGDGLRAVLRYHLPGKSAVKDYFGLDDVNAELVCFKI